MQDCSDSQTTTGTSASSTIIASGRKKRSSQMSCNQGICYSGGWCECISSPGDCVMDSWICDGRKDCDNGEDEEYCGAAATATTTTSTAITAKMNCNQGSCSLDECYCVSSSFSNCIYSSWICDGVHDCDSGEDEANCLGETTTTTTTSMPTTTVTTTTTTTTSNPCCTNKRRNKRASLGHSSDSLDLSFNPNKTAQREEYIKKSRDDTRSV